MGKAAKILERMRNSPLDWRMEDLKAIAKQYSIEVTHHASSHVHFRHPEAGLISVPSARPIKPVYIRQFVAFINNLEGVK